MNETWETKELRVVIQQMGDSIPEDFKDPQETPDLYRYYAVDFLRERKLLDENTLPGDGSLGGELLLKINTLTD